MESFYYPQNISNNFFEYQLPATKDYQKPLFVE